MVAVLLLFSWESALVVHYNNNIIFNGTVMSGVGKEVSKSITAQFRVTEKSKESRKMI